jgi:hypothetical protein
MVLHEITLRGKFHHLKTKKLHLIGYSGKAFIISVAAYL